MVVVNRLSTSGRSGKKVMRRKPSASHWVQYMPLERYSPSRAVLLSGWMRTLEVRVNCSGTPDTVSRPSSSR